MHNSACLTVFWLLAIVAIVHGQPVDAYTKRAPDDAVPGIRKEVMMLFIGSAAGGFVINVILFVTVACMAKKSKANEPSNTSTLASSNKQDAGSSSSAVSISYTPDEYELLPSYYTDNSNKSSGSSRKYARSVAPTVNTYYTGNSGSSSRESGYYAPSDYQSVATHHTGNSRSINELNFSTPIQTYAQSVAQTVNTHNTGSSGSSSRSNTSVTESEYIRIKYLAGQAMKKDPRTICNIPNLAYECRGNDDYWISLRDRCEDILSRQ